MFILFCMNKSILILLLTCNTFALPNCIKNKKSDVSENALKPYSSSLKLYATNHGYNSNIAFLIDMNIANGRKRFFVVNLKNDSVLASGLVAHGNGKNALYATTANFSNESGSYCSSEGKYKIGIKYFGRFGTAYHLYGLEKTNSNAFNRSVVLHAHSCVPDEEIYPSFICNSLGCPTVSIRFLNILSGYIDKSDKPVLLWIFKSSPKK